MRFRRVLHTLGRMLVVAVFAFTLVASVIRPSMLEPVAVQKPATSDLANDAAVTFLGTVTSVDIRNLHHPSLRWVVNLKIDKVESGSYPGTDFWFAIHSPSQEGVKVGQRYRITAHKSGDGYTVFSREQVD
jgi:hypothetical protein